VIPVVRAKAALSKLVTGWRAKRLAVGFVPTMGALHAGHAVLIARAARENDRVVVSVFVNPLQFGPNEDYGRYPRALSADRRLVAAAGADAVYAPSAAAMYPKGFRTYVEVEGLSDLYCGKYRPGHFRGVATIVLKLFNQVRADRAYFGEKDWQQVRILETMIHDLDMAIQLVRVPIVREKDGLALSSRNAYLSAAERRAAPALRHALEAGRKEAHRLHCRPETIGAAVRHALAGSGLKVQYAAVFEGRLLAAAYLGRTRLIDNLPL
jgi:pantoate--beta-alanine ligase